MQQKKDVLDVRVAKEHNLIGKRIATARHDKGMSLLECVSALEKHGVMISRKGLNKWETGENTPNAYQLMGVCHALDIKDIYPQSLPELNDVGLRKLADYKADLIATRRYAPLPVAGEIEYIDMPVSFLAASAGTGAFLDDGNYDIVSVPRASVPAGAVLGIRVSGDSMEPVYNDGQIVWIARSETLHPGEVGIFAYDGDGYIKVYGEQEPDDPAAFTDSYGVVRKQPVLISYNKKYPPRAVSPEASFQIVGRVLS